MLHVSHTAKQLTRSMVTLINLGRHAFCVQLYLMNKVRSKMVTQRVR